MSYIGKNIKKIRAVKKLSQAAFAELFHLARPSVGAYEEGRSEPKIETLVQISQYFGLSIDMLLTKELTVNELYGFDIFKRDYSKEEVLKKVAAAETPSQHATPLVEESHTFEYIARHHDATFLAQLPSVHFPTKEKKTARAFAIAGAEMQYQQQGLHPGDILFCTAVDKSEAQHLRLGQLFVAVTQNKIVARRMIDVSPENNLTLKADNPSYGNLTLPLDEVLELWEVQGVYSTFLDPPAMVEERLSLLEQNMQRLSLRLKELENK